MNKEYFIIYYQNHKKGYEERSKKWRKDNPEKAKIISKRYRDKPPEKRKKSINRSKYYGKPVEIIPFKKRISPELLAKMEENTRINNKYIKFYSTIDTRDDKFLVRDILKKVGLVKK